MYANHLIRIRPHNSHTKHISVRLNLYAWMCRLQQMTRTEYSSAELENREQERVRVRVGIRYRVNNKSEWSVEMKKSQSHR